MYTSIRQVNLLINVIYRDSCFFLSVCPAQFVVYSDDCLPKKRESFTIGKRQCKNNAQAFYSLAWCEITFRTIVMAPSTRSCSNAFNDFKSSLLNSKIRPMHLNTLASSVTSSPPVATTSVEFHRIHQTVHLSSRSQVMQDSTIRDATRIAGGRTYHIGVAAWRGLETLHSASFTISHCPTSIQRYSQTSFQADTAPRGSQGNLVPIQGFVREVLRCSQTQINPNRRPSPIDPTYLLKLPANQGLSSPTKRLCIR